MEPRRPGRFAVRASKDTEERDPKVALIKQLKEATTEAEFNDLVETQMMHIDTHFWLKINSLAEKAGNAHEGERLASLAQRVWERVEELNKAENDESSGLDEYYAMLGSPDEDIKELTAEEIMEKRAKKWINEQLSEMWRNYRAFEKYHMGEWHGTWEIYSDILGGERTIEPDSTVQLLSKVEGYQEALDGVTVCRHKQTVERLGDGDNNNPIPYPADLLDKGLDFWPNSPKTWLVANVFSTGDRVEEDGIDTLAMETAVRCDDIRMRVLSKYQRLDSKDEGYVLASLSVGREQLEGIPSETNIGLFASNSILGDTHAMLVNSMSGSNVTLATRGNLIVQTPRMIKPGDENFMQVSWKIPPTESLSEELKEVYGEAYSEQAANLGLVVTTKRVFTKPTGAAEYISLKEELPEDWKQEY